MALKISTIVLFVTLISSFIAYRAGYFDADDGSEKTELKSNQFLPEENNPSVTIDHTDQGTYEYQSENHETNQGTAIKPLHGPIDSSRLQQQNDSALLKELEIMGSSKSIIIIDPE